MRSVTPLFPAVGVSLTRPATSRSAAAFPTVATGTFSVTSSDAVPPAGTVTGFALNATECGRPLALLSASEKVAAEPPWFFRVSVSVPL